MGNIMKYVLMSCIFISVFFVVFNNREIITVNENSSQETNIINTITDYTIVNDSSFQCEPTWFLFVGFNIGTMGPALTQTFEKYGFDIECKIATKNEYGWRNMCRKYNINTSVTTGSYRQLFCDGGRIFHLATKSIVEKYQLHMYEKFSLNQILRSYCNDYHTQDDVCNFYLLTYNMNDKQQRIEFLSQQIDCKNDTSQIEKTWLFKEDKEQGRGIHFYNNHKLIYRLIYPNKSEQYTHYKNCSNLKPIKTKKYFRNEGFTFNKIKDNNGYRVSYNGLVMQQFISNPLLIENRMFHLRAYGLIPLYTSPFIVLHYPKGFIFRNSQIYDNTKLDKAKLISNVHARNRFKNNIHTNDNSFKASWGYNRFQNYLNQIYGDKLINYTKNKLQKDIIHIVKNVYKANWYFNERNDGNVNKIDDKKQELLFHDNIDMKFHLYCLDIIITENFELKLLELNRECGICCPGVGNICPADEIDNDGQEWMCNGLLTETTEILMEIYKKKYYNQTIDTIESLNNFQIILWKS